MEQNNAIPAERDFLDLRHTLCELAGSAFTLTLGVFLSLLLLIELFMLYAQREAISIVALSCWGLLLLFSLCACAGVWLLYFKARREQLSKAALRLMRAFPIAEAVLTVLCSIFIAAALIVVVFSGSMVQSGLSQLAESLAGTYFAFTQSTLAVLGKLEMTLIVTATSIIAAVQLLIMLRALLLCSFLKRLCIMEKKNSPLKTDAGFLAVFSFIFGTLSALLGTNMAKVNLSAGLFVAVLGGTVFAAGLLLYRASLELRFLYTYYAKLNRAVKKRADAIRARKEALMNQPLAIPAPEETTVQGEVELPSAEDAPSVIEVPAPEVPVPEEAPDVIAPREPEAPPMEMPEPPAPEDPAVIVAEESAEEEIAEEEASQSSELPV